MTDQHYENPRLAAIYDLDSGWSADREFYLGLAAGDETLDICDLGCGTGLLCDAYAGQGHRVIGVDPTQSMLDVAKGKPHGAQIDWVCAPAQAFRSGKRFDLMIMTGHVFQVLLSNEDILAAFATVRNHLKPEGRFVFESRNPAIDWASEWNHEYPLEAPGETIRIVRRANSPDGGFLAFETRYVFSNEELVSNSLLRFAERAEIEALLAEAGLEIQTFHGDWDGSQFDAARSHEMIFQVRLA